MSVFGSRPDDLGSSSLPSSKVTLMLSTSSITWLLVTM